MTKKMLLLCGVWACLGFLGLGAVYDDPPSSPPAESRTIIGPYGGDIRGFVTNPTKPKEVYAVSYYQGQVFKSSDSGASWKNLAAFDCELYDIALAPSDPKRLYVLGEEGVSVSEDAGATWTARAFGTRCYSKASLAVDPKDPDTIYVAGFFQTDPNRYWITSAAFFISRNAGKTWTTTKPTPSGSWGSLSCFDVSRDHPDVFYVAGDWWDTKYKHHYIVFRSGNRGKSWKNISPPSLNKIPTALAADRGDPGRLFLTADRYVLRSSNGGATWTSTDLKEPLSAVAIDPAHPSLVYAGGSSLGFRSPDGGLNWTRFTGIGGTVKDFLFGTGRVLAGTSAGVFKSVNNGHSWSASHQNLCAMNVETVAVSPSSPQVVYAALPGIGLSRSANGGKSWARQGTSTICGGIVDLAVRPDNPDWFIASVMG
jgi:photosystem II stability/assembly factor-like uncharacterized protein